MSTKGSVTPRAGDNSAGLAGVKVTIDLGRPGQRRGLVVIRLTTAAQEITAEFLLQFSQIAAAVSGADTNLTI